MVSRRLVSVILERHFLALSVVRLTLNRVLYFTMRITFYDVPLAVRLTISEKNIQMLKMSCKAQDPFLGLNGIEISFTFFFCLERRL